MKPSICFIMLAGGVCQNDYVKGVDYWISHVSH